MLKNPRFLLSTLTEFRNLKDPQGKPFPEIALVGRSNVGKSSLINHLLNKKKLVKTSATPGKTQLINFFSIDERLLLVDLPGYGFANAPLEAIDNWSQAIDAYLNNRPTLRLVLLLVDSRREMNTEDRALIEWAENKKIPLWVILTKTDKLSRQELETRKEGIQYSIMQPSCRDFLVKRIEKFLWG